MLLRRTWLRRTVPAGIVAVLAFGGMAVVRANASADPVGAFRSTTVATGSVEQRLDLTGSVRPVKELSQGFAVSGTVGGVSVAVGDRVTVGQTLATLDPGPLGSAVTAAEAELAQAKATLESDQASAAGATSAATAQSVSSPERSGTGMGKPQSLAQAQRGLTTAQSAVATDLKNAAAALQRCAPFLPSKPATSSRPGPVTTGPPTSPPTATPPTGGPAPSTTTTTTPSDAAFRACTDALGAAPTPQQIQRDEKALTRSRAELTAAVSRAITSAGKASEAPVRTNPSGSSDGQSSAARLTSDQGAVTSAEVALTNAQADLTAATLRSSIVGTVGSVDLVVGASSQGKKIVIVGTGAVEVTVNVPLASMSTVHLGQKADVTPQGATASVPGAVTSIGLLPSTTAAGTGTASAAQAPAAATASSPSYPVVVLLPHALPALSSGSRAQVSLLIGRADDVLTVPNSALTPIGSGQALALTLKDGVATRASVKTGYAGTLTTQITSGLTKGQQVVLADLGTALPTNTTNSRRFGVGGGTAGGLGGAGLGGAGLGGEVGGRTGLPPPR